MNRHSDLKRAHASGPRNQDMRHVKWTRGGRQLIRPAVLGVMTFVLTLALTSISSSATRDRRVLEIIDYAYVTATHSIPSHAVTAADLLNAADTPRLIDSTVHLVVNIGDILAYPRLALFGNSATFKQTCVNFPKRVDQRPYVITCPPTAIVLWQQQLYVMDGSREAVAAAEKNGLAVAGSDLVEFFAGSNIHIVGNPHFQPGQGGVVRFAVKMNANKVVASGDICVRFPKTEAGIPIQISCFSFLRTGRIKCISQCALPMAAQPFRRSPPGSSLRPTASGRRCFARPVLGRPPPRPLRRRGRHGPQALRRSGDKAG